MLEQAGSVSRLNPGRERPKTSNAVHITSGTATPQAAPIRPATAGLSVQVILEEGEHRALVEAVRLLLSGDVTGARDHQQLLGAADGVEQCKALRGRYGRIRGPDDAERRNRDRYIAAAVLVGDQRPYVAALILPAWGRLTKDQHLTGTPERLVDDERVRSVIKAGIDDLNGQLASFETIKRFRLVSREFTEANGELTPSLKIKRSVIQHRYQNLIDEMYSAPRAPDEERRER